MDNTGQVINKKFIDDTETKHNPEKANSATKHTGSETKLP